MATSPSQGVGRGNAAGNVGRRAPRDSPLKTQDSKPRPFPRLARSDDRLTTPTKQTPNAGRAITQATDPRWVLAVRVAESLQGATLNPERRQRLINIGKMLGLSPFDANLIIAIVQDQARRGYAPSACPAAGEAQLAMIPLPRLRPWRSLFTANGVLRIAALLVTLLVLEMLVVHWLWG